MKILCNAKKCVHYYTGRVRLPGDARMHWNKGMCKAPLLDLTFEALPGFPSCTSYQEKDGDDE